MENSHETGIRTALGTLLIESGHLDSGRLDEALRIGADTGERLGEVVVRMGWASEDDLAKTLAEQWHLRYVVAVGDLVRRRRAEQDVARRGLSPRSTADAGQRRRRSRRRNGGADRRAGPALRSLLGDRIDCVVVAKTAIDAGWRERVAGEERPRPGGYGARPDRSQPTRRRTRRRRKRRTNPLIAVSPS